jgi:hypothetical protein
MTEDLEAKLKEYKRWAVGSGGNMLSPPWKGGRGG